MNGCEISLRASEPMIGPTPFVDQNQSIGRAFRLDAAR
jgi:hypothetical protein